MTENSNRTPELSEQEIEQISAYLDEQLTPQETTALEERLRNDAFLRGELEAMRRTVALIRTLPPVQAPRSFALTAEDVAGVEQEEPPQRVVRPSFGGGWIMGLAAAIVVVVVGILVVLPQLNAPAASEQGGLAVADQPTQAPLADEAVIEAPAEDQDFADEAVPLAAESRALLTPTAQPSPEAETQVVLSRTMTAVAGVQATPTQVPPVGVSAFGLTQTYSPALPTPSPEAGQAEPQMAEVTGEEAATLGEFENTATALAELDTAESDAAEEDGAILGGMAESADGAPEAAESGAAAPADEDAVSGTALVMEPEAEAEAAEPAELAPAPQMPALDGPTPEALLQTALRWLTFLLKSLYGA